METVLLIGASAGLLAALTASREGMVAAAVAGYTGVLLWLMRTDMDLLLLGLVIAIALGVVAVGRRLRHEIHEPATNGDDRHKASRVVTTNPFC